jgi:hypothetical protein
MGESASAADTSGPAQAFSEIVFSEDGGDGEYQDLGDSEVDESDEQSESESESEPEEEQEHERDLGDVEVGEDSNHSDTDMDQSEEDEDMLHQLSLLLPHRVPGPTPHHDHEVEAGEARQNPANWNGRGSVDSDRDVIDPDLTLIDGSDSSVIDPNPDYIDEIHVRTAPRANSAPPPRIVQTRDFRTLVPGDEIRIGVAGPHFTLSSPSLTTFISHHLVPLMPEHPHYPGAGTTCPICREPFHSSHSPVQVVNVTGCRNHIFGYQCLRKTLGSGMGYSRRCPLCRTKWFRMRKHELRRVNREWRDVEMAEERASTEGGGGFFGISAVARKLIGLGKTLAGW